MEIFLKFGGKEKNIKYSKSRSVFTRTKFPVTMIHLIAKDVISQKPYSVILNKYNLSEQTLNEIFHLYNLTGGTLRKSLIPILGNKLEPYYRTEDDMITPEYKYEDLSLTEKEFYESSMH